MANDNYRAFFETLVGKAPYPYQERVAEHLLRGNSIVLRAPTGAGKTWSTIIPFLYSLNIGHPIADRLIYALPLRSLAAGIHQSALGLLQKNRGLLHPGDRVETVGKDRDYTQSALYCSLQMGTEPNDPFFESDLLFTTIDQVLSNYLCIPVSLPDRVANVNAGALIGAFLVFDEVHLLEPSAALGTVVEMLDRLSDLSQFVLMTATLPDSCMKWFSKKLGAEVIALEPDEIRHIPSQVAQRRQFFWSSKPLTAEAVWQMHHGGRTIVLVNTVPKAQQIFAKLEQFAQDKETPPHLLLLHSRFFPEDRKAVESQLQDYFGPDATKTNVILVTTQVIEAGMDLSADDLHTELAPMNTLIQRAGRVARYVHRNRGRVIVYELEAVDGRAKLGPYKDQKGFVDASREILCALPPKGAQVDYLKELEWLNRVHEESEHRQLGKRYDNLNPRRERVNKAIESGDRGLLTELVRDATGVNVLVSASPEQVFGDPNGRMKWPQLLSVPPESLIAELDDCFRMPLEPNSWIAKAAQVVEPGEGAQGFEFKWNSISHSKEFFIHWLIALHPNYASYDTRYGLRLGQADHEPPLRYGTPEPLPRAQYLREEWGKHAERIRMQARYMASYYRMAAKRLAKKLQFPSPELVEQFVESVCLLHDTGKLAVDWQEKAWKWQWYKEGRSTQQNEIQENALAHTLFNPATDGHIMRNLVGEFPPHAVEGAYASGELLCSQVFGSLPDEDQAASITCCLVTAIARHHGARTSQLRCFRLIPNAAKEIKAVFSWQSKEGLLECQEPTDAKSFGDKLLSITNSPSYWPFYCVLVRRLRLADQGAVQEHHHNSTAS
jgi:CRISPR-associated endonuclease/helicase Cas3